MLAPLSGEKRLMLFHDTLRTNTKLTHETFRFSQAADVWKSDHPCSRPMCRRKLPLDAIEEGREWDEILMDLRFESQTPPPPPLPFRFSSSSDAITC